MRDCEDCVVHAVCRQLRTRNCVRCKFFLWVLTEPVIESSHSLEFGEWHTSYPQLDAQFLSMKACMCALPSPSHCPCLAHSAHAAAKSLPVPLQPAFCLGAGGGGGANGLPPGR